MSRRGFLRDAGVAAAAASVYATPAFAKTRRPATNGRSVAILGGGMAGLAAAHELAERGFKVTVYERKALGGKARSIPVAGTAAGGRRALPGEHGFRFFPGFYHHIPDSMRRTPYEANENGVHDNLVDANGTRSARANGRADAQLFGILPDPGEAGRPDGLRQAAHRGARQAAGRPAAGGRVLHESRDGLRDELRRAPLRPVGAHVVVGLRRRRDALGGVPEGRRARPDANARRREGDGRQHSHDREHGRGVRHEHHAARQRRRAGPRARRADERGLDRPVGGAPARARREVPRGPDDRGARHASRPRGLRARQRPPRPPPPHRRGLVRLRDAGRARPQAPVAPRARRRSEPRADARATGRLDERDPVLPAAQGRHHRRARDLRRRALGADRTHAGPVLGRARLRARLRRRQRRRLPVGRRLRLGHTRDPLRQAREAVHA